MSNIPPGYIKVSAVEETVKSFLGNGVKSLEKLALYIYAVLEGTGAVHTSGLSPTIAIPSIAAVLAALHISTPKKN